LSSWNFGLKNEISLAEKMRYLKLTRRMEIKEKNSMSAKK